MFHCVDSADPVSDTDTDSLTLGVLPAQGGPCQWISSASTSALAQEVDQRHASKPDL